MALASGSMDVIPFHVLTLFAAEDVLIFTTSVRKVTIFEATPL